MKNKQLLPLCIIVAVFALLYWLLSFGNHHYFHTYCLDLGVYNNVLYDYGHGHYDDCSAYLWKPSNALADHFDLFLMILSPLGFIFGQYTLLIVQIVAVLLGGIGIYKLIGLYNNPNSPVPLLAMVAFLSFFGVWHALAFDYHSNVVAAMLLPWMLYLLKRERYPWAVALALLMSLSKETMPLWLSFVLIALIIEYRHNRKALCWLAGGLVLETLYFILVALVIMPHFGTNDQVLWRYAYMGRGFSSMATFMLTHPWQTAVNFFTNFTHDPDYDFIKLEFWLACLASGMLLLFRKPHWMLMILPVVAQKMLARDAGFWGLTFHYNIELAPVFVAGSFIVISQIGSQRTRHILALCALALTIGTTAYSAGNPLTKIRKENVNLFNKGHFHQYDFNTHNARRLMEQIPNEASVCATSMFVPHLAMRERVHVFPIGLGYDAEYYLLLKHHWSYYDGDEAKIEELISDTTHYTLLSSDEQLVLLQRK